MNNTYMHVGIRIKLQSSTETVKNYTKLRKLTQYTGGGVF